MTTLRIGGVPEHFNFPFHLAMQEGLFEREGIDLQWQEFPDGTGAMCKALRNDVIDLAVTLPAGLIKDIALGNPSKIIQNYVSSPLVWGVHVDAKSEFKNIEDLENKRVAISRFGSGSHIMAFVQAQKMGWDISRLEFVIVATIEGAIKALQAGEADYFMWEHFTTKPIVDAGIFRRVSDFPSPWSTFVIAAKEDCITNHKSELSNFLAVINTVTADFKKIPSINHTLSNTYGQKIEDIDSWLKQTKWSQNQFSIEECQYVQNYLLELDILTVNRSPESYLTQI